MRFACVLALILTGCSSVATFIPNDINISVEQLSTSQEQVIARRAYAMLDTYFSQDNPIDLPNLNLDDTYRKLFITVLHNNVIRCCMSGLADAGDSNRIFKDIDQAVERCIEDTRYGGALSPEEAESAELVFNFLLANPRRLEGNLSDMKKQVELGIHALEIVNGKNNSYFKESVPISKNYDLEKTLQRLCSKANLDNDCYLDPETQVLAYDTRTFKADRNGTVTELYRYNTPLPEIDESLLNERISLAEEWFLQNTNPQTGLLEYMYYPSSDSYSSDNNHVRQLATLWSMVELRNFLKSDRLDSVIRNTFEEYLLYSICTDDSCYIDIDDSAKIAYNAFMILGLIGRSEDSEAMLSKLGQALLNQQQADGFYYTYFNSDSTSGADYYPGESMLALMRLYEHTGDRRYLDSVYRAFPYYRSYWRNKRNTAFVPWHTQAYLLLYEDTKDPEVAEFVFEMNDWLIDTYQINESPYHDIIGAFNRGNPRNATFVYMEGINDAYKLALMVGDTDHAAKYKASIQVGTRFTLLSQYTAENSFYIENPARAIGGFRESLTANPQRIDYVQHAVSALMKVVRNDIF